MKSLAKLFNDLPCSGKQPQPGRLDGRGSLFAFYFPVVIFGVITLLLFLYF